MKNSEMLAIRETLYDNRCKLLLLHRAMSENTEISEDEANGFRAIFCDILQDVQDMETRLSPDDPPLSAIGNLAEILQFPDNGNGAKPAIQTGV